MRRAILVLVLFLSLFIATPSYADPYVRVNGRLLKTDAPPVLQEGRVFVPIRPVLEALGFSVQWQESPPAISVFDDHSSYKLDLENNTVITGINYIPINPAPIIHNGRVLVPLRMVSETLGAIVDWLDETRTAYVMLKRELPSKQIIDNNLKNIVTIYTDKAQGSGFYFNKSGGIITNKHVVENPKQITVKDYFNIERPYHIFHLSPDFDIAIILPDKTFSSTKIPVSFLPASVNETVIAIGSPLNIRNTYTTGKVTGFLPQGKINLVLSTAKTAPGSSGGALFDSSGNVVGITSAILSNNKDISASIPIHCLGEVLEKLLNN